MSALRVSIGERVAVQILGLARTVDADACDHNADQLLAGPKSYYVELLARAWRQLAKLKRAEADKKISSGSELTASAQGIVAGAQRGAA